MCHEGPNSMTLRDDVWHSVLLQLRKTGYFRISDLPFADGQTHTVRRVLRQMEELLEESSPGDTTPLDGVDPVARSHADTIRRETEKSEKDF